MTTKKPLKNRTSKEPCLEQGASEQTRFYLLVLEALDTLTTLQIDSEEQLKELRDKGQRCLQTKAYTQLLLVR